MGVDEVDTAELGNNKLVAVLEFNNSKLEKLEVSANVVVNIIELLTMVVCSITNVADELLTGLLDFEKSRNMLRDVE